MTTTQEETVPIPVMAAPMTYEELKAFAFHIPHEGIRRYWPLQDLVNWYAPVDNVVGAHCCNNDVVAWVHEVGQGVLVCPWFEGIMDILVGHVGRYGLYVPFSNWDHPADQVEMYRWLGMRALAREWAQPLPELVFQPNSKSPCPADKLR